MEQGEPTTGNIAKALRVCFEKTCACSECPFEHESCGDIEQLAADRLESQERELSGITGELERFRTFHERYAERTSKKYIDDICALTARAEQAERERDAAYDMLQDMRGCDECKHLARTWKEEPCNCCCREYSMFELCGLPQDGEGK